MTLAGVFDDLVIMGVFLMIGFVVREFVKPFQRWFLPTSVIGGVIALICGQQVLGIVTIPESFPSFNGVLMRIIMACVVLGVNANFVKMKNHLDYVFANTFLYGAQMLVGIAIMVLCAAIWPGMPEGWGILGTFAYFGSHGGVGSAGQVLEEMGSTGAVGLGMILATGGLIFSMVAGMAVVNYGVKKGWAAFVQHAQEQPEYFYHGIMPKEKRDSIGETTTTQVSINVIAFHFALICVSYALGRGIFQLLIMACPIFSKLNAMLYGLVGGLIVWQLIRAAKLDSFFDKRVFNQISGFCLEILILTSMASMNLNLLSQYLLPLLIHILVSCVLTAVFVIFWFKKIGNEQWFEKCVMVLGTCTGSSPNGLALVRAIDPDSQSCAPEAHGVYNAIFWWNNLLTPILPALILTNFALTCGIAAAFVVVTLILAVIVFHKAFFGKAALE